MAFIPQDEEDSNEVGMNVLAGQEQTIQQPVEQQNQQAEQQVSAGQSASIQGNQPLGSQVEPSQGTRKSKGSGMYTDVRKYINANSGAGDRLGSAVSQNIQKSSISPAQKLAEQSKRIQQNYAAQQQALGQAQQTSQQAGQQAQGLVNTEDLQAQQQRLQSRLGALGNLQQGGYQNQIASSQQAYQAYQPQIEQAQAAQTQANQLIQQRQNELTQAQQQAELTRQDLLNQANQGLIGGSEIQGRLDAVNVNAQEQALQAAQQEQAAKQQALQNLLGQQTAAQNEIQNFQDLQNKYERSQDLLGQIANVEQQLSGQTELDPAQLEQVRSFLSGEQKFDVGNLNTLEAQRQAQNLSQQALDLQNKNDIRRKLLSETFGNKYTRGMSGLDDIILARTGQIGKLKEASQEAASNIKENIGSAQAQQLGLREDLINQVNEAKAGSEEQLQAQLNSIMGNLDERAQTGQSGRLGELYQALQSPEGLSQEQLAMLGGEQKLYGLDIQDAFQKALEGQTLQAGDVATATDKAKIDALRKLLGQEDTMDIGTVEPGQYSTAEQNVFDSLKNQIQERQTEYQNARQGLINQMVDMGGQIVGPIAPVLAEYAQTGKEPTDEELYDLQSKNYWTHAGEGRQGWNMPIDTMRSIINRMRPQFEQLSQNFSVSDPGLKAFSTGEAAKDGLIKRNALRKLLKRG